MSVTWDLMLHIIVASFLCGHSFHERTYWFAAFFGFFALAGVVAAIGGGAVL